MKAITTSLLLALSVSSAFADKTPSKPSAKSTPLKIRFIDTKLDDIGTATLTGTKAGVVIALDVHGLSPGEHAIHIHETPKCQVVPDGSSFTSAGGHFNPTGKHHGLENKEGPHAGDMKNFTAGRKGKAKVKVIAANVTMDDGPHSVFANGGTALVIHEKADDGKSDPGGNAGERIACAEIVRPLKITKKKILVKDLVQPIKIEKQ